MGGEEVDMMVYTARTKERAVKRTAQAYSTPQKTPDPWSIDLYTVGMGSAGQNGGKRRRGAVRSPQRQNEETRAQTDDTGVFPAQGNPHAEIHGPIRP